MDRSYPHFADCAAPGDAHKYVSVGSIIGDLLIGLLAGGSLGTIVAGIATAISGSFIGWGCAGVILALSFAWTELILFKNWYYSKRLMCIDETGRCVVGTLVGNTWISFDGDQKFDVLIAPFSVAEVEQLFRDVIADNPAQYGVGPADPGSQALGEYVDGLDKKDRISLYMRVVREKMITQAGRDYQSHYLIRDQDEMGSDAFDNTPDDTFGSADPNPMFKMDPRGTLAPYLHQELEGNALAKFIDNLIVSLTVAIAAIATFCALFGPLGILIGAAIAFLVWLIAHFWANDPDDGNANQTDVGFSDPALDGDQSSVRLGDTMVVYGNWIADTEHDNYFELHPVRAIYLLCRNETGDRWDPLDDLTAIDREARCAVDVTTITEDERIEICGLVEAAENPDPVILREKTTTTNVALSTMAGLL